MALVTGDITCTSGLSKDIFDAITASASGASLELKQRAFAFAIANAVVMAIQDNAEVMPSFLIAPSGGGPVTGTGSIL